MDALPHYGAGGRDREALSTGSARVAAERRSHEARPAAAGKHLLWDENARTPAAGADAGVERPVEGGHGSCEMNGWEFTNRRSPMKNAQCTVNNSHCALGIFIGDRRLVNSQVSTAEDRPAYRGPSGLGLPNFAG